MGILLAVIFAVLGLIHVYWAAGGKALSNAVVPTLGGARAFEPSRAGTLAVAFGLFAAMAAVIGSFGWFGDVIAGSVFRAVTLMIALLFLLRAVGDFRLVGFFKPASDSAFAYWDTLLYSPLCLVIAIAAAFVAIRDT